MAIDALRQPEYTHALPEWSPDPLAVVTVANLWKSDSGIWQATFARADGSVYLRYIRNWNRDHCPEGKDSPAVGQPLEQLLVLRLLRDDVPNQPVEFRAGETSKFVNLLLGGRELLPYFLG